MSRVIEGYVNPDDSGRGNYAEWQPRPFRVQLEGDAGERWWVKIPAAIGRYDASSQARYQYPGWTALRAQPFVCEACAHLMEDHDSLSGRCSHQHEGPKLVISCGCVVEEAKMYPGEQVVAVIEPEDGAA